MSRELKINRGVTLLEIMMALLIMSSAMIPIASLMGYGGRATSKDARRIVAIQTLEKTLRQLLVEPYDEIPTGKALKKKFNNVELGTIVTPAGYQYEVELDSSYVSPVNFSYQPVKVICLRSKQTIRRIPILPLPKHFLSQTVFLSFR